MGEVGCTQAMCSFLKEMMKRLLNPWLISLFNWSYVFAISPYHRDLILFSLLMIIVIFS